MDKTTMKVTELNIKGVYLLNFDKHKDNRGHFTRFYCHKTLGSFIREKHILQINYSHNKKGGTVRGLHYQAPPFSETKIITCIQGKVFDVAVDLRKGSPTFLKHYSVELSEKKGNAIVIPDGVAHGYQTLADNTNLLYLHTEYYAPKNSHGISPFDPMINIEWPISCTNISSSDKLLKPINKSFKGIEL